MTAELNEEALGTVRHEVELRRGDLAQDGQEALDEGTPQHTPHSLRHSFATS